MIDRIGEVVDVVATPGGRRSLLTRVGPRITDVNVEEDGQAGGLSTFGEVDVVGQVVVAV